MIRTNFASQFKINSKKLFSTHLIKTDIPMKIYYTILFVFCANFNIFAQSDSLKNAILQAKIKRSQEIIAQLEKDMQSTHIDSIKSSVVLVHAPSTIIGAFTSGLIEGTTKLKKGSYTWRIYTDMKFKRPFMLFIQHHNKHKIRLKPSKNQEVVESKDAYFIKIANILETTNWVIEDVRAEFEALMQKTLEKCEQNPNCENCWMIQGCD